jgi:tagatose-6-phosphate ketose/aldose isomerase
VAIHISFTLLLFLAVFPWQKGVGMSTVSLPESEWLRALAQRQPKVAELLGQSPEEQQRLGYFCTLREILQQPSTWMQTCELMQRWSSALRASTKGIQSLVLTGSGSSEYAGDCVRLPLQNELGVVTQALGSGAILAHGSKSLPPGRPGLMISLARSGDSPESVGALTSILKTEPEIHHLVLTCNSAGRLATAFSGDVRVTVIALDRATNDQSLVMTSSFTNLVTAARFLGLLNRTYRYKEISEKASRIAEQTIEQYFETIAEVAKTPFKRAVFLGSGPSFGAAREAGLKMLEMTAGGVTTLCETYLGLRHGPMSYIHDDSLIVAFLSSDPIKRAYESDLLRELNHKRLGLLKVIVGEDIPSSLVRSRDVTLESAGLTQLGDESAPIIHVVVGQLLAFFRCLCEGLRPDSPSENGVISRVVQSFPLHIPDADSSPTH